MRLRFWRWLLIFAQQQHSKAVIAHQQRQDIESAMRSFSSVWEHERAERDHLMKAREAEIARRLSSESTSA